MRAHAIGTFRETEGLTVYLDAAAAAAASLRIVFRAAWITMTVHSDLEAVGFTAAFAQALAARGIAANVVAGAFHDHVFVPWDSAQDAMKALNALQGQAISTTPPGSGATKSSDAIPARASASARRRGGSS